MNRRSFLKSSSLAGAGLALAPRVGTSAPQTSSLNLKTKHLIWIVNGNGCRKKEYLEDLEVAPNFAAMAKEGFVFNEDHNDQASSHGTSYTELLTGNVSQTSVPLYPTVPHYVRKAYGDEATKYWYLTGADYFRQWRYNLKYFAAHKDYPASTRPVSLTTQNVFQDMWYKKRDRSPRQIIAEEFPDNMGITDPERVQLTDWIEGVMSTRSYEASLNHPFIPRSPFVEEGQAIKIIPQILQTFKPRMIIFQQVSHDTGHGAGGYLRYETGHDEYRSTAISTDEAVGQLIDFVKNDPYFSKNTAIVVRPEFGRDDEVNAYGEIHHSKGYYYAQRPASIYYGPDFNTGFDGKTVISRLDMAPTLTKLFNVDAVHAMGQVVPGLFKPEVGEIPQYVPYVE
jgi:hypothetical protein